MESVNLPIVQNLGAPIAAQHAADEIEQMLADLLVYGLNLLGARVTDSLLWRTHARQP